MSGGRAATKTMNIKVMVGVACSGNPRDKNGECRSRSGGGRWVRMSWSDRERYIRIGTDVGRYNETTRRTRDNQTEI